MSLAAKFAAFDLAHPEVWDLFCYFTWDRIRAGFEHYSADAVLHRVRWETSAGSTIGDYKINNNYSAFYARKFHDYFPSHADFFRCRASVADLVDASVREWAAAAQ